MNRAGDTVDHLDDADDDPSGLGPGGDPRQMTVVPPPGGAPAATDGERTRTDRTRDAAELDDAATVSAVGKLSEAVEWVERARGSLYDFHQLTGRADELLVEAADALDAAGHPTWAAEVRLELVGRNVIDGRWTFQVVDEYDDTYWTPVRTVRERVETALCGGERHTLERRTKEQRRTHGRRHHEADPPTRGANADTADTAGQLEAPPQGP